METNVTNVSDTERHINFILTANDLKPHYEKAYRKAQPTIALKGFRKGSVPIAMVRKHFGRAIENEAIEDIASDVFTSYVRESGVQPVAQPALRDIKKESDGSLTLLIEYHVAPEFELQQYREVVVKKMIPNVTEASVDDAIVSVLRQIATLEEAEQVEGEEFVVKVVVSRLDEATGTPLLGEGNSSEERFRVGDANIMKEVRENLMNAKVGDSFFFTRQVPAQEPDAEPTTERLTASVREIQKLVFPELNDELVQNITRGVDQTVGEFREHIRKDMIASFEAQSNKAMADQLLQNILDAHTFTVPEPMIMETLRGMLEDVRLQQPEGKMPKDFNMQQFVQGNYPVAHNATKWSLIRNRIVEAEKIGITELDLVRTAEVVYAETLQRLNGQVPGEFNAEEVLESLREEPRFRARALNDKIVTTLLGYAVVEEESVEIGAGQ